MGRRRSFTAAKRKDQKKPNPFFGIVSGVAGGLAASLAMDAFQLLWGKLVPMPDSGEPSTVKAAENVSEAAGAELRDDQKSAAGQVVHYAFGAALGGAYGLIAEYEPDVTVGGGSLFGLGSAVLFDEVAVPVAGLSGLPTEAPAITHAYALASHLLYGLVTEGGRGLTRKALADA